MAASNHACLFCFTLKTLTSLVVSVIVPLRLQVPLIAFTCAYYTPDPVLAVGKPCGTKAVFHLPLAEHDAVETDSPSLYPTLQNFLGLILHTQFPFYPIK